MDKREELRRLVREAIEEGACNWDSYLKPNRDSAEQTYTDAIWALFHEHRVVHSLTLQRHPKTPRV